MCVLCVCVLCVCVLCVCVLCVCVCVSGESTSYSVDDNACSYSTGGGGSTTSDHYSIHCGEGGKVCVHVCACV